MFLVVGPAHTADQFEIGREVEIAFTKTRIGVEHIWIVASEVIVAVSIQARYRIGIDIAALKRVKRAFRRVGVIVAAETFVIVGNAGLPWRQWGLLHGACQKRKRVDEDVIAFVDLIMQIVGADAEVERAREIGGKAEFLAELPGFERVQIFADDTVAATELRIAKHTVGRNRAAMREDENR